MPRLRHHRRGFRDAQRRDPRADLRPDRTRLRHYPRRPAVGAIKLHVEDFGQHESGLLFTTDLGSFVGTSTLHGAWQRAARRVGTDATPHDLRHYFASVQIRGGQSIKVLQALLGHKSAVETWDTYGHLMGDEDDRSRAVIDAALGGADVGRRRSAGDRRPRLAMETTGP